MALRRYPRSWLIQGSLLVQPLARVLAEAIPPEVRQQVEALAIPLDQVTAAPVSASEAAARWADHWSAWWTESFVESLHMSGTFSGAVAYTGGEGTG